MVSQLVTGIVAIVIGVVLVTSLAGTVNEQTSTGAGSALENVSASGKALYGLYDLIWAALGLVFIVGGGFLVVGSARATKMR